MDDDMDLIVTASSAIEESKGITMHVEGNLFIPLIVGIMSSLFLIGFMILISGMSIVVSLSVGVMPAFLVGVYITVFKNNKPPNYQEDLIGTFLGNGSVDPNPVQPKSSYFRRRSK